MIYMFNELSLTQVNSIAAAQNILETFVKSTVKAKEYGLDEIRLHESINNIYQFNLLNNYRVDDWLKDSCVNSDIHDKFREIFANTPLLKNDEVKEKNLYENSEFSIMLNNNKVIVFGLGAAYIYGTLALSLSTHNSWSNHSIDVRHYSITHNNIENTDNVGVFNFDSVEVLEKHKNWIDDERKNSLEKSADLWKNRVEYFPNILFGTEIESQLKKIGLTKKFYQIFDCLNKLNEYAKDWRKEGFNLYDLREKTFMDVSPESNCTMQRFSSLRKFSLSNGQKEQFELHIKLPDVRIYFFPNEITNEITVGYIGKHLRTCLFN